LLWIREALTRSSSWLIRSVRLLTQALEEAATIRQDLMSMRQRLITLLVIVASASAIFGSQDERIWLNAKINGKPVHLVFDSGSNGSALTPRAMKKLGLKFIPAPPENLSLGLLAGDTEEFTLTLAGADSKMTFLVLDLPALYENVDFDGLVGWRTLSCNIMQVDAVAREVSFLPNGPRKIADWTRLSVVTNLAALDLAIPHASRTNGVLSIDTGFSDGGLALAPEAWTRWKEAHPESPVTLEASFSPAAGLLVFEEAWADEISIGPITLTGVPIQQASSRIVARWGDQFEGCIGLAGLKRLDLIVDGNSSTAYLRAKKTRPPAYNHNRLGAVFVPTAGRTNQAVAQVVQRGPAYEAGVRDGDVLIQVDDVSVTSWSSTWIDRFSLPAGTKVRLTLKRDGETIRATATLREILQPRLSKGK
jgi:hypothetical protein